MKTRKKRITTLRKEIRRSPNIRVAENIEKYRYKVYLLRIHIQIEELE